MRKLAVPHGHFFPTQEKEGKGQPENIFKDPAPSSCYLEHLWFYCGLTTLKSCIPVARNVVKSLLRRTCLLVQLSDWTQ